MGLIERLGTGPVGLDTSVFIYFIEEHPRFLRLVEPIFKAIDSGALRAVTSSLTLLEVLVMPLRTGNRPLAARYEAYLTRSGGLRMVELERPILWGAAQIRATTRARTPDALQLATALASGCRAFVTGDRDLPAIPGLRIVKLRAA